VRHCATLCDTVRHWGTGAPETPSDTSDPVRHCATLGPRGPGDPPATLATLCDTVRHWVPPPLPPLLPVLDRLPGPSQGSRRVAQGRQCRGGCLGLQPSSSPPQGRTGSRRVASVAGGCLGLQPSPSLLRVAQGRTGSPVSRALCWAIRCQRPRLSGPTYTGSLMLCGPSPATGPCETGGCRRPPHGRLASTASPCKTVGCPGFHSEW
jgi:hypothetical protein